MNRTVRTAVVACIPVTSVAAWPLVMKAIRTVKAYQILSAVDIRSVNTPFIDPDAKPGAPAVMTPQPGSDVV